MAYYKVQMNLLPPRRACLKEDSSEGGAKMLPSHIYESSEDFSGDAAGCRYEGVCILMIV